MKRSQRAYQPIEVGWSLIYLATCTRPDIAYAVSKVSKYLKNPTEKDWIAVKRILRYLKGIQEVGLALVERKQEKIWKDG